MSYLLERISIRNLRKFLALKVHFFICLDNYYFRLNEGVGSIGKVLEKMIIKDKNQRADF
jgi:hypothetical protein